jgi:hypothetical protein
LERQALKGTTFGSHKSCNQHFSFLCEEMMEFELSGFRTLLPFPLVKEIPNLCISPLGIIPQRNHRLGLLSTTPSGESTMTPSDSVPLGPCNLAEPWNAFCSGLGMRARGSGPATWPKPISPMAFTAFGWPPVTSQILALSSQCRIMKSPGWLCPLRFLWAGSKAHPISVPPPKPWRT